MSLPAELDERARRLLALFDGWAERGLVDPHQRSEVLEYLRHREFELAWDLAVASVRSAEAVSDGERTEAADLLRPDWPADAPMTVTAYAGAALEWSPASGEPFPRMT